MKPAIIRQTFRPNRLRNWIRRNLRLLRRHIAASATSPPPSFEPQFMPLIITVLLLLTCLYLFG